MFYSGNYFFCQCIQGNFTLSLLVDLLCLVICFGLYLTITWALCKVIMLTICILLHQDFHLYQNNLLIMLPFFHCIVLFLYQKLNIHGHIGHFLCIFNSHPLMNFFVVMLIPCIKYKYRHKCKSMNTAWSFQLMLLIWYKYVFIYICIYMQKWTHKYGFFNKTCKIALLMLEEIRQSQKILGHLKTCMKLLTTH